MRPPRAEPVEKESVQSIPAHADDDGARLFRVGVTFNVRAGLTDDRADGGEQRGRDHVEIPVRCRGDGEAASAEGGGGFDKSLGSCAIESVGGQCWIRVAQECEHPAEFRGGTLDAGHYALQSRRWLCIECRLGVERRSGQLSGDRVVKVACHAEPLSLQRGCMSFGLCITVGREEVADSHSTAINAAQARIPNTTTGPPETSS